MAAKAARKGPKQLQCEEDSGIFLVLQGSNV
jgi:hypothetical protein